MLEPLVPISLRESQSYLVNLDAKKLLTKSTLYDLSGYRLRVFSGRTELNQRGHMFGVPGTFIYCILIKKVVIFF